MLLVFCFFVIFASAFYGHKYFKRPTRVFPSKNKNNLLNEGIRNINSAEMSGDEFCEPSKAKERWSRPNVKIVGNSNKAGIFNWKRKPTSEIPDNKVQNIEKRQKVGITNNKENSVTDTIDITDDESTESISDDQESPSKVSSKLIQPLINLESDDSSSSPEKSKLNNTGSLIKPQYLPSPVKYNPMCNDVPLPVGMPPMIAGVPVKFPVTPYKSQISVMNAVIKGCKNKEHCLLESPTGSGKTLALLCAALGWQSSFVSNQLNEVCKKFKTQDVDRASSGTGMPGISAYGHDKVDPEDDFQEIMKEENIRLPKIYYGSRTHKQIEQVIREFRKTAYKDKPMTILSSREHTCIQDAVKGVSKTQLCNELLDPIKKKGGCKYYTKENKGLLVSNNSLRMHGLEMPWDIEDLVGLGKRTNACPYFAARTMMEEADIIFCPYNYLLDPVIRDSMQIKLDGHIIIVDEAHNIEGICRDVGSAELREDNLSEAIEDCRLVGNLARTSPYYDRLDSYLKDISNLIQEQHLPETSNMYEEVASTCWTGEQLWTLFKMHELADERFLQFQASVKQAITDYKEVKEDIDVQQTQDTQDSGMGNESQMSEKPKKKEKKRPAITFATKKLLEELLMALSHISDSTKQMDYRCAIVMGYHSDAKIKIEENTWTSNQKGKRLRTLKFMCMNPALMFRKIAQSARSVILASGTLSPTSTFESELGIKFVHKLHANHVVPKDQVYVRGIPCGPNGTVLRATYRNVQTLPFKDDLGKLLIDVCQSVPHGVLCFFSSYSMMTSQIERWQETNTWDIIERSKHILKEPRTNADLDAVMTEYREVVRDTANGPSRVTGITGPLLFAVFRGKVAEGIDFSDNEARCVLTIGIPYAVQSDPGIKLKREYNDLNRERGLLPGGEWYSVQAYRALNQALGRCIRHRNDWGAVLLVDERLIQPSCAAYLPKWIREMRREGWNYNLKEELKEFVRMQKIHDEEKACD